MSSPTSSFDQALAWSGHLRRRLDAHPDLTAWLMQAATEPLTEARLQAWMFELAGADASLPVDTTRIALRKLRERVFLALIVRDLGGQADLGEVVTAMTSLADLSVAAAYRCVADELEQVHGMPRETSGAPQEMLIVGMGKTRRTRTECILGHRSGHALWRRRRYRWAAPHQQP